MRRKRFKRVKNGYLDKITGLIWSRESGPPMSQIEATKWCAGMGLGWRMPTVKEMIAIIDYSICKPATELPDTSYHRQYWTSTRIVSVHSHNDENFKSIWTVDFEDGAVNHYCTEYMHRHYVRAVRGVTP